MATATHAAGTSAAPAGAQRPPLSERVLDWFKAHKQITSWLGAILVVGAGLFVWTL